MGSDIRHQIDLHLLIVTVCLAMDGRWTTEVRVSARPGGVRTQQAVRMRHPTSLWGGRNPWLREDETRPGPAVHPVCHSTTGSNRRNSSGKFVVLVMSKRRPL